MPVHPGTRLGPYEIVNPLGAGGMGEVYRAHDSKLGRDVALKVLPPSLASDQTALARFEREARSVAQLSHPNILGIFDFGHEGPTAYAVMELLEGETLRAHISDAPLPPRKAIEYSVQIAHGLAAAHDKGIVHRDLKPENIFITRDDRVKILDFGLAKPMEFGTSAVTMANTVGTASGTIMGTVGYMSPEQVRGHATDHRSDIFAFGVVLYEMVTGRRAFAGDTPADTIGAILNADVPEIASGANTALPALDRIIRRCLEKKPELRFQSAHDLAFALETVAGASTRSGVVVAEPGRATPARRGALRFVPVVLLTAAVAGVAGWLLAKRTATREPVWQQFTPVTDAAGEETTPALSPDGNTVLYATFLNGASDIFSQRVGGRNAVPIAADPNINEAAPSFSPDGKSIAFHESDENGGLFIAGATGESIRRLTAFGFHPAWSPDGKQLVFGTEEIQKPASRLSVSSLWIADVAGGEPRKIHDGDAAQPSWSPSGRRIAFWSNTGGQRDIYTIPAAGGQRVAVVEDAPLDWCPVWTPDGRYLYFASNRGGAMNLWRISIDESSGNVRGAPEPVTTGVQAASELPSLSKDGSRLAFRSSVSATNPVSIPFDPITRRAGTPVVLSQANSTRAPAAVSPDGQWIAYANIGEFQEDLFIGRRDGGAIRRITDDAARDRLPTWSPDGKSLLFYSNRGGEFEIWSIGVDGGSLRKVASRPGDGLIYPILSPSGDRLVATTTRGRALIGKASGPAQLQPLDGAGEDNRNLLVTDWSRDGRRLTGPVRNSGGVPVGIAVYDLETRVRRVLNGDVSGMARWLTDSRHVMYFDLGRQQLVLVDADTGRREVIDVRLPMPPSFEGLIIAPDGRAILYGGVRAEADIWIVEKR
ncbi:MAG: serine/threonine-protein kinase [Acidobacteria bacterium]|nr:serine/threonine-protein kinase [Acidobacteriota bacterium]